MSDPKQNQGQIKNCSIHSVEYLEDLLKSSKSFLILSVPGNFFIKLFDFGRLQVPFLFALFSSNYLNCIWNNKCSQETNSYERRRYSQKDLVGV